MRVPNSIWRRDLVPRKLRWFKPFVAPLIVIPFTICCWFATDHYTVWNWIFVALLTLWSV